MRAKNRLLLSAHALCVVSGGAFAGWFVQLYKHRLEIDTTWNIRLFFLAAMLGCLAYFLWFTGAYLYAKSRKKEMGLALQADAYSYVALVILPYYQYFQKAIGIGLFVGIVFAYFGLLKVILFVLADSGKVPHVLKFSFHGRVGRRLALSLIIVLCMHYVHQASFASSWFRLQKRRSLSINGQGRTSLFLNGGNSLEHELDLPEDAVLCLAYGFTDEILAGRPPAGIKRLDIAVDNPGSGKGERLSVPLEYAAGWNDVTVDLGGGASHGTGTMRIAARGGTRMLSWPWSNPLCNSVALATPYVLTRSEPKPPNIILISVDALRPDHIHSLGYSRPITPMMDALIQEGTTFARTVAPATWTIPSNIGMMSSIYPMKTRLKIEVRKFPRETLVEFLSKNHYLTAAVTDGGWISHETAFMHGFQIFCEERCIQCSAARNFDVARQIIERWSDFPVFIWLYSNEVHNTTWHPLPIFGKCDPNMQQEKIDAYDAALESFDAAIGDFIDYLKDEGLYDRTIMLLTSDHGNAFGETHNNSYYIPCGHGDMPYNEQMLIPMIVKPQKEKNVLQGKIFSEFVSGIDIAPTLLDLAGLQTPEQFEGISLVPALSGEPLPRNRHIYSSSSLKKKTSLSLIVDSKKIIYPVGRPRDKNIRFYNLENDPGENIDIFTNTPEQQEMVEAIKKFVADAKKARRSTKKTAKTGKLSPELSTQLRALGYVQ